MPELRKNSWRVLVQPFHLTRSLINETCIIEGPKQTPPPWLLWGRSGCSHPSRHLGCVVGQHLLCPQHIFALIVSSWLHSEILLLVYVTGTWQSLWNGQCTVDMYALTARSLEHRSLLSKYKSFHVAGHSIIFIGFGRYFCREKKSKSLQPTGC